MSDSTFPSKNASLRLKEQNGWFAAGEGFRRALTSLSDGAFRLFAYLCLNASRQSGCLSATHKELAAALGKSKRAIGTYAAELEQKGVCRVVAGRNQFAATLFEISDSYWPYCRNEKTEGDSEEKAYVDFARECFLSLGCTSGAFGAADVETAKALYRRGIPATVIQAAMLTGACRKYISWSEGNALEPVRSLAYFDQLILEVQKNPLPPEYCEYLKRKVRQLSEAWNQLPANAGAKK
jgi:hypothetical protein